MADVTAEETILFDTSLVTLLTSIAFVYENHFITSHNLRNDTCGLEYLPLFRNMRLSPSPLEASCGDWRTGGRSSLDLPYFP